MLHKNYKVLKINAFKASDHKVECLKFVDAHQEELRKIGVTKLDSSEPEWISRNDVYAVCVYDGFTGKMLAGAKIEKASPDRKLPIQRVMATLTPDVDKLISKNLSSGICEMTGLWISEVLRKQEFTPILTRTCLALLNQLSIKKALVLSSQYTINTCKKAGFEINEDLGDKGMFSYPTPEFQTFVATLHDTKRFEKAETNYKSLTVELAEKLRLTRVENENFLVDYDLDLRLNETKKESYYTDIKPSVFHNRNKDLSSIRRIQ